MLSKLVLATPLIFLYRLPSDVVCYLWSDWQRCSKSLHCFVKLWAEVEEDSESGLQVWIHTVQIQQSCFLEEEQHILELRPATQMRCCTLTSVLPNKCLWVLILLDSLTLTHSWYSLHSNSSLVSRCSYLAVVGMWGPLRDVAGESCSRLLWSRTRRLYRGLWLIQRCRAPHASCCMLLLVKLTASAMRASRLLGWSSRHLQQVRRVRSPHSHLCHIYLIYFNSVKEHLTSAGTRWRPARSRFQLESSPEPARPENRVKMSRSLSSDSDLVKCSWCSWCQNNGQRHLKHKPHVQLLLVNRAHSPAPSELHPAARPVTFNHETMCLVSRSLYWWVY